MQLLRSSEGVSLSGNPVDVVIVEAPREAARGAATDLRKSGKESEKVCVAHSLTGSVEKSIKPGV